MPTYVLRGVPSDLIRRAKARARELGESLDQRLLAYLTAYAHGTTPEQMGRDGGRARAAKLSPEERSRIARTAAQALWAQRKHQE